jgi:hypothetical protein
MPPTLLGVVRMQPKQPAYVVSFSHARQVADVATDPMHAATKESISVALHALSCWTTAA